MQQLKQADDALLPEANMPVSFKPILVINIKNGVGSGPLVEISRSKVFSMKN